MNRHDTQALLFTSKYALHRWMRGELDYPPPCICEAIHALDHLRDHELPGEELDPDRVDYFRKMLLEPDENTEDISEHFHNVAQHRISVRAAYELWALSAPGLALLRSP